MNIWSSLGLLAGGLGLFLLGMHMLTEGLKLAAKTFQAARAFSFCCSIAASKAFKSTSMPRERSASCVRSSGKP